MIEARDAIYGLMNEYCLRIDAGDLEGFARLFEHGTWQVLGDPGGGDTGTAAVLTTLQNVILYDGKPRTRHMMTNVQIDVNRADSQATAQCYITVFQSVPPDFPLQAIFSGHYHDEFERVAGAWRFTRRDISPDLVGDLSRHRADMAQ
jgi:hypothetical protein